MFSEYRLMPMEELEKLEIKASYLEDTVAKLNDVVIDQERTIGLLLMRIESLERKVEDLIEVSSEARPSRRPPHY